eukprot:gene19359-27422_t
MSAEVYLFPGSARLSEKQKRQQRLHHDQALLDLLEKPGHSARNLHRQLARLIPASCAHTAADDIKELVARANDIALEIETLTFAIAAHALALEENLKGETH